MHRKPAVILLAFLATAFAMIVCPPDRCKTVKCMSETKETCEAKGQEYRPSSTFCGCCDRCFAYIGKPPYQIHNHYKNTRCNFACLPGHRCRHDICDTVRCIPETQETCDVKGQEFRPKSTFCGCCNRCVAYIEDGQSCNRPIHVIGGAPVLQPHCRPGSSCVEFICKRNATY